MKVLNGPDIHFTLQDNEVLQISCTYRPRLIGGDFCGPPVENITVTVPAELTVKLRDLLNRKED